MSQNGSGHRKFVEKLKQVLRRLRAIRKRRGILFIGYAEGDLGLGQSFRSNIEAMAQTGVPFAIYPFQLGVETRPSGAFMPKRYDTKHAYDINFIEVAPDQVPVVFQNVDRALTESSYNILRTFWELPRAPRDWRDMLAEVHELWVPNAFVAEALKQVFTREIAIVPPTVEVGEGPFVGREAFGMEAGRYYFLFSFDYLSSPYRKNPEAVLRAFQQAFDRYDNRVGLIIKSIGPVEYFPEIRGAFLEATKQDPRIIVIDRSLPRGMMLSLIRASDAYVSLHRSEGFGMGMVEAMNFGRVVIGTDFSGNTDFLTSETGFPVPFALRAVEPHEYTWTADQLWAEPDIGEAAAIMRLVLEQPDLASKRAKAGQKLVRTRYNSRTIGETMRRRIETIQERLPPPFAH
jgi:glycosyltransferase involved in cell wall biosynthesis